MTLASIPIVRRYRFGVALPAWQQLLVWLVAPLALGWLSFALLDSVRNFAPQEIRLSADGEYDPYMDDFVVFYSAGAHVARGDADSLYEPEALRHAQAEELRVPEDSIIQLPFYNPPPYVLPLVALSLAPLAIAAVIWTVLQLAAVLAAFGFLWLKERRDKNLLLPAALLLGVASSMPFHETVLHGQMSFLLVGAWVLLWFGAFERRSDGLVAVALTVFLVKPQLAVVPLAYLALTGRWRALALAAGVQVVLGVATSAVLGVGIYARWLGLLIEAVGWEDENGIWIHAMFGWNAFVRALVGEDQQAVRSGLTAGLVILTAVWCGLRARRLAVQERQPELFAMLVFASLLMSPHLFAQDLMLSVAPILFLSLRREGKDRAVWVAYGALGWLLTFVHFDWLIGTPEDIRLNWVSVWLAAGAVCAGMQHARPLAIHRPNPRQKATLPSGPGLALQLGLAAVIAGLLFLTVPGLAGQKMAKAIEYSYSSAKGPTYRIVIIGLASE